MELSWTTIYYLCQAGDWQAEAVSTMLTCASFERRKQYRGTSFVDGQMIVDWGKWGKDTIPARAPAGRHAD